MMCLFRHDIESVSDTVTSYSGQHVSLLHQSLFPSYIQSAPPYRLSAHMPVPTRSKSAWPDAQPTSVSLPTSCPGPVSLRVNLSPWPGLRKRRHSADSKPCMQSRLFSVFSRRPSHSRAAGDRPAAIPPPAEIRLPPGASRQS